MSKLYQKLFAAAYDPFMSLAEKVLKKNRRTLISHLRGNILEVGVGTGVNFQYFHADTKVIAIEPSQPMLKKALLKIPPNSNIEMHNLGVNDPALEEIIEDNSLDAVICTLVLCTVPDPKLALQKFNRWLKPDGQLVVLEHIRSKKPFNGKLQDWFNPVWKVVGEGCNLNRDTDLYIKEAGFKAKEEVYFNQSITWFQGVFLKKA